MQIDCNFSKSEYVEAQCDNYFNTNDYLLREFFSIYFIPFILFGIVYLVFKHNFFMFILSTIFFYLLVISFGSKFCRFLFKKSMEMRYLKSGRNYIISILLTTESIKVTSSYSTVIYNWTSVDKVLENSLYFHLYIGVNGRVFIPKNIQNKQLLIDTLKDNIPEHKFAFIKKQRNIFDVLKDIKKEGR
ncbi:hypothetical protein [Clostridium sp. YIM B02551]|uniref:hypothetical protein n=1 Tax=Clostridium sp. YIM B02551 TaxID=2910679 RepID=UPI001EEA82E3|nr:hypothetical protein [Clostridium sp. YIM B02551]